MWITHSYLGTTRGGVRCLFFLLFEDYIDAQQGFSREVSSEIERFARNMGDAGAVVLPFPGDAERVRDDVVAKNWTDEQRRLVTRTPSVLMIDRDFAEFDPANHQWVIFQLDRDHLEAGQLRSLLTKIAAAVGDDEANPFEVVRNAIKRAELAEAAKSFEMKPGVFGFSVDLKMAWRSLKEVLRGDGAHL